MLISTSGQAGIVTMNRCLWRVLAELSWKPPAGRGIPSAWLMDSSHPPLIPERFAAFHRQGRMVVEYGEVPEARKLPAPDPPSLL